MEGMTSRRTVLIVLYEGVQSLDVTGPLEVFHSAAVLTGDPGTYRVRTATVDGGPVRTGSGLRLAPDGALGDCAPADIVLVPGGHCMGDVDPRLLDWLRSSGTRAGRLVSVCTGAFLLAAAGLLDDRRATTHWAYCEDFAQRFPAVRLDPEPVFVRDGGIATSAGVTAGIDLALALVEEDLGRRTALSIARYLVVFLRRPGNQRQFSIQLAAQTAGRPPLRDVQHWIAEHPDADLSVESLASRANLSPRHFARAFQAEVGMPPGRYVEGVRLEAARRLLEDTVQGVGEVSRACGYGTPEAMRRAFVRALGTAPAEYRRRFRPLSPSLSTTSTTTSLSTTTS
ncbi:GlxA family transcriptional regulator [Streptomyces sp. NPDC026206]|uniref:GlxA family transcriptional regulator n=1 Tax=Streptomyces sp. NPDC026206 TaxID=3157089 RepID=UPI0033FAF958